MRFELEEVTFEHFPIKCSCGHNKWYRTMYEGLLISINCSNCGKSPLEALSIESIKFPKAEISI